MDGHRPRAGTVERVAVEVLGQRTGSPRHHAESRDGRLWLVLDSIGLASFDGETFEIIDQSDGLPTDRVWTLIISSRDQLLAGTDAGLWIRGLDDNDRGTVVGVPDGLPNTSVIALTEDLNGRIWAGTTHGVSVVSPDAKVLRTFTAHEGLSDTEAAEGAAWRDSRGHIWLGMADGVTVVDPSRLSRNLVPPEVVLENVKANGETYPGFRPTSTTGDDTSLELRIDPDISHLRFDFSAPSFVAPETVRFRLALTCFGDQFSQPTTDRHVTYHILPAGKYRFGIQAINNDGVPSAKALWVDLDVRPPWYRTHWFQLMAILTAGLFGAGLLQLRNLGRLRRQAWLEEEVKQRTTDLDAANQHIREQNVKLTELSRTDPLTGLGNRRVLADILPIEMSILRRGISRLGPEDIMSGYHAAVLMMIDLDHFKRVNDRWGHEVGDKALVGCARILSDEMRECDQAIRWGGEEFFILARGQDREGTLQFAQRVLDRFNSFQITTHDGTVIPIRASFGFLQIPLGTTTFLPTERWSAMIDIADRLMYRAKERGRGRSVGLVWRKVARQAVSEQQTMKSILNGSDTISDALETVELVPTQCQ